MLTLHLLQPMNMVTCSLRLRSQKSRWSCRGSRRGLRSMIAAGEVSFVAYSSLNYKDALACRITRASSALCRHVRASICRHVVESTYADYRPGDQAVITARTCSGHWGGYAEFVRVPAEWFGSVSVLRFEKHDYGTAGFTAAPMRFGNHGARNRAPVQAPVVSRGALAALGRFAVAILAKLGYGLKRCGKLESRLAAQTLRARTILNRDDWLTIATSPAPSRWAAAVDTVGGNRLRTSFDDSTSWMRRGLCWLLERLPLTILSVHPSRRNSCRHRLANCRFPERGSRCGGNCPLLWHVFNLDSLAMRITLDELPRSDSQDSCRSNVGRRLSCRLQRQLGPKLIGGPTIHPKLPAVFVQAHRRCRCHV